MQVTEKGKASEWNRAGVSMSREEKERLGQQLVKGAKCKGKSWMQFHLVSAGNTNQTKTGLFHLHFASSLILLYCCSFSRNYLFIFKNGSCTTLLLLHVDSWQKATSIVQVIEQENKHNLMSASLKKDTISHRWWWQETLVAFWNCILAWPPVRDWVCWRLCP